MTPEELYDIGGDLWSLECNLREKTDHLKTLSYYYPQIKQCGWIEWLCLVCVWAYLDQELDNLELKFIQEYNDNQSV